MRLYADNARFVEYDGAPRVLVGSGEHYGALLNLDFDYATYFEALGRLGLNQTRVFSGTYRERPGHFGIESNTLAPQSGRFVSPWEERPDGMFDLTRFNGDYFDRLHDLMKTAAKHRVVVEFVLFCFWYGDEHWRSSPMHPSQNATGIGPEDRDQVFSLDANDLLPVQEGLVRKIATELDGYENLYYEICNEPYARHDGTAYLEWQHHMVDVLVAAEAELAHRHLIAINYQNRTLAIPKLHPGVSIMNFHYALPEAAKTNLHFDRVLADDETGFAGQSAAPYRKEAWSFIFSGGSIFSHLDYSFTTQHPDGSAPIEGATPGYGGDDLRRQLAFLRSFAEEHEVWSLRPANEIFLDQMPNSTTGHALAADGSRYLIYVPDNRPRRRLALGLRPGSYTVTWINPISCTHAYDEQILVEDGRFALTTPPWCEDLAIRIARSGPETTGSAT